MESLKNFCRFNKTGKKYTLDKWEIENDQRDIKVK